MYFDRKFDLEGVRYRMPVPVFPVQLVERLERFGAFIPGFLVILFGFSRSISPGFFRALIPFLVVFSSCILLLFSRE